MNVASRGGIAVASVRPVESMTLAEPLRPSWAEESLDVHKDMERLAEIDSKAAEESLCDYCKPVELYNIIQKRATIQPLFLQRCLSYKVQASRQRRMKMNVSVSPVEICEGKSKIKGRLSKANGQEQMWPVFVMITSPLSVGQDYFDYRLGQTQVLEAPLFPHDGDDHQVTFILPEFRMLEPSVRKGGHVILFIVFVNLTSVYKGAQIRPLAKCTGEVFWGQLSMPVVCDKWLNNSRDGTSRFGIFGKRTDTYEFELHYGTLQHVELPSGCPVRLQPSSNNGYPSDTVPFRVRISGEEIGPKHMKNTGSGFPQSAVYSTLNLNQRRLQYGRVIFFYLYYHDKLHKAEVTENFSCPFCLVECSSFTGLRYHLHSSHDMFDFGFKSMVNEDPCTVIVKCRPDSGLEDSDHDIDGISDPRLKNFFYWSRHGPLRNLRRRIVARPQANEDSTPAADQLPTSVVASDVMRISEDKDVNDTVSLTAAPADATADKVEADSQALAPPQKKPRIENSEPEPEQPLKGVISNLDVQNGLSVSAVIKPVEDSNSMPTAHGSVHRSEKTRRISIERAEARNRVQLQKRQFFHSHTAQLMEMEQLLSDKDSEDEVDDVVASFEDRRMLDEFLDVTKDEKDVMHRWNTFVRKQRVVADGHCPWAVEAFAKLHAEDFSKSASLRRCFMLMLVKFWNHHLIDGRVINNCLSLVNDLENQ